MKNIVLLIFFSIVFCGCSKRDSLVSMLQKECLQPNQIEREVCKCAVSLIAQNISDEEVVMLLKIHQKNRYQMAITVGKRLFARFDEEIDQSCKAKYR